jgi:DNA-binding NarL/FixJ family response regulator
MSIRVLVADDQRIVRAGFRAMLDAHDDIDVVGEAEDGREAVDLSTRLRPDVVLMDIRMPGMDGLEATQHIVGARDDGDQPRVLVLTTFDLDEYVYDALHAGASGFLLKDATEHELLTAVRVVAAGDALLAPSVTRRLIADYARRPSPRRSTTASVKHLTPRETEILTLVAQGMSNAEIAEYLVVTEQTVKTHVSRILTKLGLRDRVQIVVFAYESGVVTPR